MAFDFADIAYLANAAPKGAAGPVLPALAWMTKFFGDTGLVNQVPGGPPLLAPAGHAPVLTANAYGTRAAWQLSASNPDYFDLSLPNPTSQHLLVAVAYTPSAYGNNGAMLLGSAAAGLYWQIDDNNPGQCYGQSALINANIAPVGTGRVLVYYVGADGAMRLWNNGAVSVGSGAAAVAAQTLDLQIGHYAAGEYWNLTGLLAAHCIAAGSYTDAQAAGVGAALRDYYGI